MKFPDYKTLDNYQKRYWFYVWGHIHKVQKIWNEVRDQFDGDICLKAMDRRIAYHDISKFSDDEFYARADFHYNNGNSFSNTKDAVNVHELASKHHYKHNLHHHQHWVSESGKVYDMDELSVVEMLCDMAAACLSKRSRNNPAEFFSNKRRKFKITPKTEALINKHIHKFDKYGEASVIVPARHAVDIQEPELMEAVAAVPF